MLELGPGAAAFGREPDLDLGRGFSDLTRHSITSRSNGSQTITLPHSAGSPPRMVSRMRPPTLGSIATVPARSSPIEY